jgi:excisionase family DNA binding protein
MHRYIRKQQKRTWTTMPEEKYLDIKETSRFLKISMSTLNRLIKQNKIPSYKIGDRRLFDKDELIEWMRTQKGDGHRR